MVIKDIKEVDKNMKDSTSQDNNNVTWIEIDNEVINNYMYGKAIRNGAFNRLDSESINQNLDYLKLHPAGENLIFETNSSFIKIDAKLLGAAYMSHMTAVGTIGFSLYFFDKNKWRFLSCTKVNSKEYTVDLIKNNKKNHTYRLYFPLYQELISCKLGVDSKSNFKFLKDEMDSLLIYGTSISQGGCATRPGMDYGSILGRLNNLNVINLGFSGSCHLEKEIIPIINNAIDHENVKYLIFELEANSPSYEHLETGFTYFLENLHNLNNLKVYLISHFDEGMTYYDNKLKKYRKGFKETQIKLSKKYNINFLDGEKLIKDLDCDGTVDGVHLTDLGFYNLAKKLSKIVKK